MKNEQSDKQKNLKPSCEKYFVGKRRGHHSVPQAKTNKVLLEMAEKYSCVVRLKGGDPFLFGRGAEEAAFFCRVAFDHVTHIEQRP